MRTNKSVHLTLVATFGLALTGCAAGSAKDDSVGLVIWADETRGEVLQPFVKKFGDRHGIKVSVDVHSNDKLQEDFVTASEQGEGPDVLVAAHDWIGNLVQNSSIDPVQHSKSTRKAFDSVALDAVTYDGKVYGTPYARENLALIRNTDLAPDEPSSVEDLTDTGSDLVDSKKAEDILSTEVSDVGDPYHMYPFFASAGGYLFGTDKDGEYDPSDLGLSKKSATKAFEKLAELGKKGVMKTSMNADNSVPRFAEGKTPYMISGQWALPKLADADIDYDVTPIPAFKDGDDAAPFIGVQGFYVANQAANKTMASEFVTNYASTSEISKALYKAEPRIPALTEVYEEVAESDPDVEKFTEAAKGGDILPAIPEMAAVWDPLGKAEAAVLEGKDPGKAMDGAAKAVSKEIG